MSHPTAAHADPDVVFTDDHGQPWWTSDDPAVVMETEARDSHGEHFRTVVLRPGFVLEDVAVGAGSGLPVFTDKAHGDRSMQLALLLALRTLGGGTALSRTERFTSPGTAPVSAAAHEPEFRSVAEVADWLGISSDTVYGLLKGPLLPARARLGDAIRVHVPTARGLLLTGVGNSIATPVPEAKRTAAEERVARLRRQGK